MKKPKKPTRAMFVVASRYYRQLGDATCAAADWSADRSAARKLETRNAIYVAAATLHRLNPRLEPERARIAVIAKIAQLVTSTPKPTKGHIDPQAEAVFHTILTQILDVL